MHNMFDENAEHGKFLHLFPSLLGCSSQIILNGDVNCCLIPDRQNEPAQE